MSPDVSLPGSGSPELLALSGSAAIAAMDRLQASSSNHPHSHRQSPQPTAREQVHPPIHHPSTGTSPSPGTPRQQQLQRQPALRKRQMYEKEDSASSSLGRDRSSSAPNVNAIQDMSDIETFIKVRAIRTKTEQTQREQLKQQQMQQGECYRFLCCSTH